MYDERQHLDLYHGPGAYLFRGALPSKSFDSPYEGIGVTPTSTDPIVATLFACRYRMRGPAVILISLKSDYNELLDGPNLSSFGYELAVNIDLPPDEFERRCLCQVPVELSLQVLREMGYSVPSKIADHDGLAQSLQQTPRMYFEQITTYVERCRAVPE